MHRIIIFSLFALLMPGFASSDMVKEVAGEMCKCGVPPKSACMDKLAKKYPQMNSSVELQNSVMDRYQHECVARMGAGGGANMGMPAAAAGRSADGSDCSTSSFTVEPPKGWKCRKMGANPQDVTLYAYGNKLNVTLGKNQGKTSCSVIPGCKSAKRELSSRFESTLFTNPMIGTHEYSGHLIKDDSFKLTITSNIPLTDKQLSEVKTILESFEKR